MEKLFEFDSEEFDDHGSDSINYVEDETDTEESGEKPEEGRKVDKIFDNNFGQV